MRQTTDVVRQQIAAMKSEVFELGLFRLPGAADGLDAGMLPRAWDAETLLRHGDLAMYYAKSRGRDNYQFFATDMNICAVEGRPPADYPRFDIGAESSLPLQLPTLKAATGQ